MKFSICIPNYNYGHYIGETIESVLNQEYGNFEILIADNQSTDDSWDVIQHYVAQDPRIKAWRNETNLGFAGNLDAVSSRANGDFHILLSSDDLMNQGALSLYSKFLKNINHQNVVISSSCTRIDKSGKHVGKDSPKKKLWTETDLDDNLSERFQCPIYKVESSELLRRCLLSYYGPFNFASTCYKSSDYKSVGGYLGGRMYNPDKWFHWRLLSYVDFAYFIDKPLFSYRWHDSNQANQQKQTGDLRYFIDEYRSSFEVNAEMLNKAKLDLYDIKQSFIYNVILKYTFSYIKRGQLTMAKRVYNFGLATYPNEMKKNKMSWLLKNLLRLGKVATLIARPIKNNYSHE